MMRRVRGPDALRNLTSVITLKPANGGHLKTSQRTPPGTLTSPRGVVAPVGMANVLSDEEKHLVSAVGRLQCSLRRIEQATGVRRDTVAAYLKAAGSRCDPRGGRGRRAPAH